MQQYKSDKKAYNKSFNKAYYHNHAYSLSKKKRQASADRWNDAIDKSRSLNSSKKAYKSAEDIENCSPVIFDLDNLICCSHNTHEAIHYGNSNLLPSDPVMRRLNDTCL